jgi:hypothetical protein
MKIDIDDYVHMTNAAIDLINFNIMVNKEYKEETKNKIKSKNNLDY